MTPPEPQILVFPEGEGCGITVTIDGTIYRKNMTPRQMVWLATRILKQAANWMGSDEAARRL